MTGKIRVLQDLRIAGVTDFPDSGIPQDTRLLFKTLSVAADVSVSAFIHPDFKTTRFARIMAQSPTAAAAMLLNGYGVSYGSEYKRTLMGRLRSRFDRLRDPKFLPVSTVSPLLADAVWRRYLQRSLASEDRALLDEAEIVVASMTERALMGDGSRRDRRLATDGYDFLLFPDLRRVRASPGTTKLVRYHDALPLLAPDLFPEGVARTHFQLLRGAVRDSFFICNSEPTRLSLVTLYPEMETRSAVIPCTLAAAAEPSDLDVAEIVARNRVGVPGVEGPGKQDYSAFNNGDDYILMVSTIEPRKNHLTAIEAFERLREKGGRTLKFIIVGKPAMGFDKVQRAMDRLARKGAIVHLSGVPRRELNKLYLGARALIFPSLDEGFSFTPLEAMANGTPAVVSDVPTHRWVMDDAVLYAPATDSAAIAAQLERLVMGSDRDQLAAELRARAARVLERYSVAATAGQWSELLHRLKAGARGNV